jgi:hypothetical protein
VESASRAGHRSDLLADADGPVPVRVAPAPQRVIRRPPGLAGYPVGMLPFLLAAAHATTGEPETLEVLGLLAAEHKVFLLLESGGDTEVSYYRVDDPLPREQKPDRPVPAVSWNRDSATVHDRIAWLRTTVQPLPAAPTDGLELTQRYGPDVECGVPLFPRTCQKVDLTVRWAGQQATTSLVTEGKVELVGAWTVPGTDRRLVMVRHIGVHTESGYPADVPLLLARP